MGLRPVPLRLAKVWVREHEVIEREREARVTEKERGTGRERERGTFYYFNHRQNKIINFFV